MTAKDGGICTKEEEKACLDGVEKEHWEWTCGKCEKMKAREIHPYIRKLQRIRLMQKAGYPFGANDLEYEEWMDLGKVNQVLDRLENPGGSCPLLGSGKGE